MEGEYFYYCHDEFSWGHVADNYFLQMLVGDSYW